MNCPPPMEHKPIERATQSPCFEERIWNRCAPASSTVRRDAALIGREADITINSLLSRLDELEKDAARYRWLREHPTFLGWEHDFRADEVDAAIDSAIAKGA